MLPDFLQNITISSATVPAELEGATARGVLWQAAPGRFLLDIPDVARYLVEGGERVTIEPSAEASPDVVNRFARMTPLAALLYQRGLLAFHAAAVANEQGALLLAGDSGCGKSTLLMELLQRGWTLLADELAVVAFDGKGGLHVSQSSLDSALWPDTLKKFGNKTENVIYADANRHLVSYPDHRISSPQPLRTLFRLGVESKSAVTAENKTVAQHFKIISSLLYNSHVADALLDRCVYLNYASTLIMKTAVVNLYRPRGSWSVSEVADSLENHLL